MQRQLVTTIYGTPPSAVVDDKVQQYHSVANSGIGVTGENLSCGRFPATQYIWDRDMVGKFNGGW